MALNIALFGRWMLRDNHHASNIINSVFLSNIPLQRTVGQLRCPPSAELAREHPLSNSVRQQRARYSPHHRLK